MKDIAYCNTQFKCFAKYFNGFVENLKSATIIQYTIKGRFMSR